MSGNFGYVYLATTPNLDIVKIGTCCRSMRKLWERYFTYYGPTVVLAARFVSNCRSVELKLHKRFIEHNMGGELFKNEFYDQYQEALMAEETTHTKWEKTLESQDVFEDILEAVETRGGAVEVPIATMVAMPSGMSHPARHLKLIPFVTPKAMPDSYSGMYWLLDGQNMQSVCKYKKLQKARKQVASQTVRQCWLSQKANANNADQP